MSGVVWTEAAYSQLADLWVAAPAAERDGIEEAVNRTNRLLRDAPAEQGESRAGDDRLMFQDRLAVRFRIEAGPVAVVLHVRWVQRHKKPPGP